MNKYNCLLILLPLQYFKHNKNNLSRLKLILY